MKKPLHQTLVLFAMIATLTSGCRSTDEYKKLAKAGNDYANAVDKLLYTAGEMRIDTTSELLLQDDRISNVTIKNYTDRTAVDQQRLIVLSKLRKHNQLLRDYFRLLYQLADSNAPNRASAEIGQVVDNLNQIGQELRQSDLITTPTLFEGVTNLVVSSQIRGALRQELEKRNRTIMLELTIQKEMLEALGDAMAQDAKRIREAKEKRFVVAPLVDTTNISNEDEWITTRRQFLIEEIKSQELQDASETLGEFQKIFQDFVKGDLTLNRVNYFLEEVDNFLKLVEENKK